MNKRTKQRWQRSFRDGEKRYLSGYIGLLPKTKNRGNRHERFPPEVYELAARVIDEDYCTPKRKTKTIVYGRFRQECQERGISSPSFVWFVLEIAKRSRHSLKLAREGRRAAYQITRTRDLLLLNRPIRPWECAEIDHTQCDIELVCEKTGESLDPPWLTVMIDKHSRRVAPSISYQRVQTASL